jgi:hypothetical protein
MFKGHWNDFYGSGKGRTIAQAFLQWRPGFEPRSGHLRFVVDIVALGQVFSEYFDFPCQFSFHQLLQNLHHLAPVAGKIGQQLPQYRLKYPTK